VVQTPTISEVKNEWSYTYTPSYVFPVLHSDLSLTVPCLSFLPLDFTSFSPNFFVSFSRVFLRSLLPPLISGIFIDLAAHTVTRFFADIKEGPLMMKNKEQHWETKEPTFGKRSVEDVMKIQIISIFFRSESQTFPRVI
jgi:hypothetical protein